MRQKLSKGTVNADAVIEFMPLVIYSQEITESVKFFCNNPVLYISLSELSLTINECLSFH